MKIQIQSLENNAVIILPKALLLSLHLSVGDYVAVELGGKFVLTPVSNPRYKLADLINQCAPKAPVPLDMLAWNSISPAGRENI